MPDLNEEILSQRRLAAKLLVDVVLEKIRVLDALKSFPKDSKDPSVNTCFHMLVHFEADEDLRKNDSLYKEVQDEFIVESAEALLNGESLPQNVISEYNDFYESDLFYKKETKENILKRLVRFINL